MFKWIMIIMIFMPIVSNGQGLFETAGQTGSAFHESFQLNGYARGVVYLGENSAPLFSQIRSGYGETALQFSSVAGDRADFYAEFRFKSGFEYNQWGQAMNLREAYAEISQGRFDLRMGQQIIAWGRADGINPTHQISPRDYFVRSPRPDDMNLGNFMIRGRYHLTEKFRMEAVWVPVYRYSVYRFDLFDMPDYVRFRENYQLPARIDNGTFAVKFEWFLNQIDGSFSWFNGFDPMPGIEAGSLPSTPSEDFTLSMHARAFRQQTLGFDFSSVAGSLGIRGEAAFRIPADDYKGKVFVPGCDLRYVLGIDRTIGKSSIVAMYVGQYVIDYVDTSVPGVIPDIDPQKFQDPSSWNMLGPMMDERLEGFNRVLFNQREKVSHSLAVRPAVSLFHDVMEAEIFGLYHVSTKEWNVFPRITWQVTDALELSIGGHYFEGRESTVYYLIAPLFNGGFMEMRYSF